jgi:hypothetical protein
MLVLRAERRVCLGRGARFQPSFFLVPLLRTAVHGLLRSLSPCALCLAQQRPGVGVSNSGSTITGTGWPESWRDHRAHTIP